MAFKRSGQPGRDVQADGGRVPADDSQQSEAPVRGAGFSATLAVGIALTVLVIVLALQNTESARIEFLAWEARTPLVVIILVAALAGVVFDELAGLFWRRHRRRQIAQRSELERLRSATRPPVPEQERDEPQEPAAAEAATEEGVGGQAQTASSPE
jgi:uncharacterized integral membrane protein